MVVPRKGSKADVIIDRGYLFLMVMLFELNSQCKGAVSYLSFPSKRIMPPQGRMKVEGYLLPVTHGCRSPFLPPSLGMTAGTGDLWEASVLLPDKISIIRDVR